MASPGGTFWFRKRKSEGVNVIFVQTELKIQSKMIAKITVTFQNFAPRFNSYSQVNLFSKTTVVIGF